METPDLFADAIRIKVSQLGVSLTFYLAEEELGKYPPRREVAKIRMTPAMLKLVAMTIREVLRSHEALVGNVGLDPALLNEAGISLEDW